MEINKTLINSVISKCRKKDIEILLSKWGYLSDEDLRKVNLKATKKVISTQIFQLCQELHLSEEIGDLDLLYTQLHSSVKKWMVLKLKGTQTKTDFGPQELQERLLTLLEPECIGVLHLNVKSYGGANWIRLYVSNDTFFRASDVVYVLMYPHTPIVIASQMKVKMKDMLLSVLQEAFEAEGMKELQLVGNHLPSLADLALYQSAQGPFHEYRDKELEENPLIRSWTAKKSVAVKEKKAQDHRLRDENRREKDHRQMHLDSTFGTHSQPVLEKLEYKLNLRFRGTTFAPGMQGKQDLFKCRVKFEGSAVLEGTKNLVKTGLASYPLPKHLGRVYSLAKNNFTIEEVDSGNKTSQNVNDKDN